jgi:NADH-quinone oxidoreductase subunit E
VGWPSKETDKKLEAQAFPDDLTAEIKSMLTRYPNARAAVIPALRACQSRFGYVSEETILALAELLGLAPAFVADTCSFYSMLRASPAGKYHIELCQTVSCALLGADSLADHLAQKLGIGFGEVTPDGKFSLGKVECIGACEQAPAVLINNELYGNLNGDRIDEILAGLA